MWISAVWRSGSRDAILSPKIEAAHLRLDPTSDVIAGPSFPDRPPEVPGRPKDFIARLCGRAVLLPEAPVLADGYDSDAATREDRGVAAAGVEGPIAGHGANRLIGRDLVEQVWKDGAVALTA